MLGGGGCTVCTASMGFWDQGLDSIGEARNGYSGNYYLIFSII